MANGPLTFRFKGRTYGLESLFSAADARAETYSAFGRETSFLAKLLKMGFQVHRDVVYHPTQWTPNDADDDSFHSVRFVTKNGIVRFGRAQALRNRR